MALDFISGPNIPIDVTTSPNHRTPFSILISFVSALLPMGWSQKILLGLIPIISFLTIYNLTLSSSEKRWILYSGAFYAAILYALNPFVYGRFMAGHILLLLAYSLMPLYITSLVGCVKNPRPRSMLNLAIVSAVILMLDVPTFILAGLVTVTVLTASMLTRFIRIRAFFYLTGVAVLLVGLNTFWILPSILQGSSSIPVASEITPNDLYAFTSRTWGAGPNILFSIASMHGFWLSYDYVAHHLFGWQALFAIILFLSIWGLLAKSRSQEERIVKVSLAIVATFSTLLATGISLPQFAPVFQFLFDNVFIMRAFREPQKFVALLVLAYAYLGGIGVREFARMIDRAKIQRKNILSPIVITMILVIPMLYGSNILFAFRGELKSVDYPPDWYQANEILEKDSEESKVLFLPWHLYMYLSWTERNIVNPSSVFFTNDVIYGQNVEVGTIYSQSTDSKQQYMEMLLFNRNRITNFGELISPLNIKYVTLAKEADYDSYGFLYNQTDMEIIFDGPTITVFQNIHPTSRFYYASQLIEIEAMDDIIEISKDQEILNSIYRISGKNSSVSSAGPEPSPILLSSQSDGPARFQVDKIRQSSGYVVFAESPGDGWVLNGNSPIPNLGTTSAYALDGDAGDYIVYRENFDLLLIAYSISGAIWASIMIFFLKERIINIIIWMRIYSINQLGRNHT